MLLESFCKEAIHLTEPGPSAPSMAWQAVVSQMQNCKLMGPATQQPVIAIHLYPP